MRVLRDPDSSDPISLLRRYRAYAPDAREPPLIVARARPSAWSTSLADDWSFSHIHPAPTVRGPAGPPHGAAPGRSTTDTSPPVQPNSRGEAFARASTIAIAGEGRAAGIARARGRPKGAYASSLRRLLDWLRRAIAILLLRRQRGHAVQPAPGMWNGRRGRAATPAAECAPGFRSLRCSPPPTPGHTGPSLSRAWIRSTESFGRATNSYAPPLTGTGTCSGADKCVHIRVHRAGHPAESPVFTGYCPVPTRGTIIRVSGVRVPPPASGQGLEMATFLSSTSGTGSNVSPIRPNIRGPHQWPLPLSGSPAPAPRSTGLPPAALDKAGTGTNGTGPKRGLGVEAARRGCDRAVDFVRVIGSVANQ